MTVLVERVFYGVVALRLVGTGELVGLGAHVEVLAQGMTLEVGAQEEATHVGVAEELDAHEVVDLTLEQVGYIHHIDRGYDDLVGKLVGLGADIQRVDR